MLWERLIEECRGVLKTTPALALTNYKVYSVLQTESVDNQL